VEDARRRVGESLVSMVVRRVEDVRRSPGQRREVGGENHKILLHV